MGFLVSAFNLGSDLKVDFTLLSSNEWKLITKNKPLSSNQSGAFNSKLSSDPNSLLTAILKAWNGLVDGWMRLYLCLGGKHPAIG